MKLPGARPRARTIYPCVMRLAGLTNATRHSLPQELIFGRIGMVATFGILIVREMPGYRFLGLERQVPLAIAIVVAAAAWTWFWMALAAKPDRAAHAVAVALMTLAAAAIVLIRPTGVYPLYYAVIVAGAAYKWRVGALLALAVSVLTVVVWWFAKLATPWTLSGIVITVLLGGAAVIVRRYVGVQLELHETRDELRRLAAAEARAELARDLHDQLGQNLTATVMQGELLAMDLPHDSPPELRARVRLIVDSSREALTLMRDMVKEIRSSGLQAEVAAARRLLEASGIECETRIGVATLPSSTDAAFGWIVREGATNVLRHSGASKCHIAVDLREGAHILRLTDDGQGADGALPGNGLSHIAERLDAVGGQLTVGSAGGAGHTLTATVPTS